MKSNKVESKPNMARLTIKQRRFLAELPFCSSDKEAAKRAGVRPSTVCEWKANPAFRAAYEAVWEVDLEERRKRLAEGIAKAVETLLALLDSRNPNVRLKAAAEVLDRAGLVRGERVEHGLSPMLQRLLDEVEAAGAAEGGDV